MMFTETRRDTTPSKALWRSTAPLATNKSLDVGAVSWQ